MKKAEKRGELVVILHGIGMSPLRMAWLDFGLSRAGFDTLNLAYPSRKQSIESCADHAAREIEKRGKGHPDRKIHFVTHSMGSLVALDMAHRNMVVGLSRAVLIAPPYRGSEVADLLANHKLYDRYFGPAGRQLTTAYRNGVDYLVPETVEIGVIAGTRAYEYPLFLKTMKKTGLHDGLVSVESTRIPGIRDHITMNMSHSFLLERSLRQTVNFLSEGSFLHTAV